MEPLENINKNIYELEVNELLSETPVGWSSICLDQTINYYIDCNSVNTGEDHNFEKIDVKSNI